MSSPQKPASQFQAWLPFLFALTLVGGLYVGLRMGGSGQLISRAAETTGASGGSGRVEELLRYIDARYVEEEDREHLTRTAIRAVLDELDPHSQFIPVEDIKAVKEKMEGNFDGIGIEFLIVEDTIVVVSPVPGGPSAAVGIQSGDKIIMIEDSLVAGEVARNVDPTALLRGGQGTEVGIKVKRPGVEELLPFTITRDAIPMYSVDAAYRLNDNTAYIKVNRFSATTYTEFSEALREMVGEKNAGNLIIDLRQNPGGYLEQTVKMLSQLFPERGKLLVYTEGSNTKRREYNTNGRAFFRLDDVAILIDEGSASASEILAGAVQDHDRGIIVGRRSFGKGLVQEQYELSDGSALRLTVSRYFTPSGRSIQRSYEEGEEAYHNELSDRYENGEIDGSGIVTQDSSLLYYTQNGHPVYGGGGVSPDVFVPLDSVYNNESYLWMRQEIPGYLYRYLEMNPSAKEYKDFADFQDRFRLDKEVLETLRQRAEKRAEKELAPISPFLEDELRLFFGARLAKHLFGGDYFYRVMNQEDEVVQKALELLEKDDPLAAARQED